MPTSDEVFKAASEAFWAKVAEMCPTATTGDLEPPTSIAFDMAARDAVEQWIDLNVPKEDT